MRGSCPGRHHCPTNSPAYRPHTQSDRCLFDSHIHAHTLTPKPRFDYLGYLFLIYRRGKHKFHRQLFFLATVRYVCYVFVVVVVYFHLFIWLFVCFYWFVLFFVCLFCQSTSRPLRQPLEFDIANRIWLINIFQIKNYYVSIIIFFIQATQ